MKIKVCIVIWDFDSNIIWKWFYKILFCMRLIDSFPTICLALKKSSLMRCDGHWGCALVGGQNYRWNTPKIKVLKSVNILRASIIHLSSQWKMEVGHAWCLMLLNKVHSSCKSKVMVQIFTWSLTHTMDVIDWWHMESTYWRIGGQIMYWNLTQLHWWGMLTWKTCGYLSTQKLCSIVDTWS